MWYGIIHAIRATIDAAGRLVIPREIRRQANLQAGMPLEVRWRDGRIEIEPSANSVRLVQNGRLLVVLSETDVEQLTSETVEEIRQVLVRERGLQA